MRADGADAPKAYDPNRWARTWAFVGAALVLAGSLLPLPDTSGTTDRDLALRWPWEGWDRKGAFTPFVARAPFVIGLAATVFAGWTRGFARASACIVAGAAVMFVAGGHDGPGGWIWATGIAAGALRDRSSRSLANSKSRAHMDGHRRPLP